MLFLLSSSLFVRNGLLEQQVRLLDSEFSIGCLHRSEATREPFAIGHRCIGTKADAICLFAASKKS
jgi:hypothetical protein